LDGGTYGGLFGLLGTDPVVLVTVVDILHRMMIRMIELRVYKDEEGYWYGFHQIFRIVDTGH